MGENMSKFKDGVKFDQGKTRVDLVPVEVIETLADVYALGAKKYSDWNWKKGMKWSRIFGAVIRHLYKFYRGMRFDLEDKHEHLAAALWGVATLMEYQRLNIGEDDRPCVNDVSAQYVAGLMDGEGWFTLLNTKTGVQLEIGVSMTQKNAIEKIANKYGGNIFCDNSAIKRGLNAKPKYVWRCPHKIHEEFIIDILPFLAIKKEQATTALDFLTTKMPNLHREKGVPEEIKIYREIKRKEMRELNKRGKDDRPNKISSS